MGYHEHIPLRNEHVNYQWGWFFVTCQVAHNKSVFGAIVGKELCQNDLGKAVAETWLRLPTVHTEMQLDSFVLMPNHFHAILKIRKRPENKKRHLSYLMGIFKSSSSLVYLRFLKEGLCPSIGPKLWNRSFYDCFVADHDELLAYRGYIARNPARWNEDRFGPITGFSVGNTALLIKDLVGFVASAGAPAAELAPRKVLGEAEGIGRSNRTVFSTFTSAQEREMLRRCLRKRRPFAWVAPGGIPDPLPDDVRVACDEGRGVVVSPVAAGTGVNKQRAIWCNQHILQHADETWAGYIRPGGTLETLIKATGLQTCAGMEPGAHEIK